MKNTPTNANRNKNKQLRRTNRFNDLIASSSEDIEVSVEIGKTMQEEGRLKLNVTISVPSPKASSSRKIGKNLRVYNVSSDEREENSDTENCKNKN
ncbi:hypothetical protein ABK040_009109 [Willaertia magna]